MKTSGVTINPSLTHSQGRLKSTPKLTVIKPPRKRPAYFGESSPVVNGLAFVRSTCLSISLSVKSLIIHPADLQLNAPIENRAKVLTDGTIVGDPRAMPQKHGKSNKCVPIYL